VGRRCYIGWPFLIEAVVTRVVDGLFSYRRMGGDAAPRDRKSSGAAGARMVREPMEPYEVKAWPSNVEVLERTYARRGIITGPVNVVLTVRPIKVRCHDGRKEIAHTVELMVGSFSLCLHLSCRGLLHRAWYSVPTAAWNASTHWWSRSCPPTWSWRAYWKRTRGSATGRRCRWRYAQ